MSLLFKQRPLAVDEGIKCVSDRAWVVVLCPPSLVILALLLIELQSSLLFESVIQTAPPSGG